MLDDYKGISREAMLLIYASILPSVAMGMFYTDAAYFLTAVQGLPDVVMGTVIAVIGISAVVASVPLGIAADRHGKKQMLIVGNVIGSIIIAVFALTTDFMVLLIAAIMGGISEGAYAASSSALMSEKAGDRMRTAVFSLLGFVSGIAFGAGSFAIPMVSIFEFMGFDNRMGHVLLYVFLAILSLASTALLLKISEPKSARLVLENPKGLFPKKSKDVLIKYVASGAIVAFGAGLVVPLMTRWLGLAYGVSDAISGPILGVSSVSIGVSTLLAPTLAKKMGMVKAIVATQGISTIFMFAIPFSPEFLTASALYTVRSFLMNMSSPLQQSMIMGLVDKDERGAASGISSALWRLPNSLSTGLGAWMMGLGLLAEPFYSAAGLYVVSIAMFWSFFRNVKMPEEK